MRYLLLTLFICGCSSYPVHRVGIIHDYIFNNATKMCTSHEGLHYIVVDETITRRSSNKDRSGHTNDYPCYGTYYVRCQDQVLLKIQSEVAWCVISELQIKESL